MAEKCSERQWLKKKTQSKHETIGEFKNLFLYTFFLIFFSFFNHLLFAYLIRGLRTKGKGHCIFYKNVPHSFHFCFILHAHLFPLSAFDTVSLPTQIKNNKKEKNKTSTFSLARGV